MEEGVERFNCTFKNCSEQFNCECLNEVTGVMASNLALCSLVVTTTTVTKVDNF